MTELTIILQIDGQHGTEHRIDAPADLRIADFISELIDGLALPSSDERGGRGEWLLRDEGGNTLDERKTLQQNGITTNQRLLLFRYEPDLAPRNIQIEVHTQTNESFELEVSTMMTAKELLSEIIQQKQLPAKDSEGNRVSWVLDDKDIGKTLSDNRTLAANRVANGHQLHIRREVVAGGWEPEKSTEKPPIRRRPSLDPRLASSSGFQDANVRFTTYCPKYIQWHSSRKLLTYIHVVDATGEIERDAQAELGSQLRDYSAGAAPPTQAIKRGVKIKVVPRLAGCVVSPPFIELTWRANWHRADFHLEPQPESTESHVFGSVSFYVGPVLIAEVGIESRISTAAPDSGTVQCASSRAYSAIFVSYSRRDTEIVKALEKAYSVLGFEYLRDVQKLRSGEDWNRGLLQRIEEADVFQLCWSSEARASRYVEQEWRHALIQQRPNFIRPVYWDLPLPTPPVELSNIHFAFLDLGGRTRLLRRIKKRLRQILNL